jgi:hypothetical protein
VHEVEHRRLARDRLERARVALGGGVEIGVGRGHRVRARAPAGERRDERGGDLRPVAVGMAVGHGALVGLEQVRAGPAHRLARERAQHRNGRGSAGEREHEAPALAQRGAALGGDARGGGARGAGGVREDLEGEGVLRCAGPARHSQGLGACQPPCGAAIASASAGPQLPGS